MFILTIVLLMFVDQKVREIALALFKVAVDIRRPELRSRIENLGFAILEKTAAKEWEASLTHINVLNTLIGFGNALYLIEPINANILLEELRNLNAAIREIAGLPESGVDISSIFSKPQITIQSAAQKVDFTEEKTISDFSAKEIKNNESIVTAPNAAIRQSAIMDRIRQSGKITIRDIMGAFPGVSERTLRYDLQKLCSQQALDRIGNGGPATYYTLRNKVIDSSL